MCDDNRYMAPLHLAGRLIMENGGETYRVEETITRMGHAFGFAEVESFAVPSGIFISYRKGDGSIETAVKRVRRKGTDLTRVDAVNAVSRRMEREALSCEEVMALLTEIETRPPKITKLGLVAAVALSSAGWAVMFGGGVMDCVVAFVVAFIGQSLAFMLDKAGMRSFVSTLLGSMLGQYCARRMRMIASIFVLLSMIPLVPGLGLFRCMQYLAQEMYGAGADAGVRAMVDIVMIALGLAVGSFIYRLIVRGRSAKGGAK